MTYRNLDIWTLGYRRTATAERFRVCIMSSPAGDQRPEDAEEVKLPTGLRQKVRLLAQRDLRGAEIAALGKALGDALFPPKVRQLLKISRETARAKGDKLRIRLKLGTYALADLPWEFARIDDEYLAFDPAISLVRYEIMDEPIGKLGPVGTYPLRLVAALANPITMDDLNLTAERRNLEQALADLGTLIQPVFPGLDTPGSRGPTMTMLNDAFLGNVHIFHFSGHGRFQGEMSAAYGTAEGQGELLLVGPAGEERPVKGSDIARALAGKGIRLAVLNACETGRHGVGMTGPAGQVNPWTGVVPALVRKGVPAVVGMQFPIRDRNAIAFSRKFYQALAAGLSVDEAVFEGRKAILAQAIEEGTSEDERDWGVPVLYLRADEEEGVLFPRPAGPGVRETTPARGATDVRRDLAEVRIRFDRPMRAGAWTYSADRAFGEDTDCRIEGDTFIITRKDPARLLEANKLYQFTLNPPDVPGPRFQDVEGNPAPPLTFGFTTGSQPEDQPMPPTTPTKINLTNLRLAIRDRFTLDELETLCADLQQALEDAGITHVRVGLEMIGGVGVEGKARELIELMKRNELLPYLVDAVRKAKPGIVF